MRFLSDARTVLHLLGLLLLVLGGAMVLPALVDLYADNSDWLVFVAAAAATLTTGGLVTVATRGRLANPTVRQAFVLTTLAWVVLPAFAALPFLMGVGGIRYADAVFEAVSGITTTGATVLTGLSKLPPGLLLWRALLQWLGGLGIIAMATAIFPYLRVGGMQLFRTESSDRSDKIVPRPGQLAGALVSVYLTLSFACFLAYLAAGMRPFDALAHMMTTVSTAGFSTHDESFAAFGAAAQVVAIVFMLAGGLPFVLLIRAGRGEPWAIWRSSQARTYLTLVAAATVFATVALLLTGDLHPLDALRHAAFNIVSVVTTTGFASLDYQLWGSMAVAGFFFLTFVGGCTGSTTGGIKIFRFEVLFLVLRQVLRRQMMPHGVFTLRYEGRALTDDVVASVVAFVFAFFITVALLTMALAGLGLDFVTAASAAATAVANVGPGLGHTVGPAGHFGSMPDAAKWLLSLGMLLGRLELFTVFALFSRRFWQH